ncbi:hypothetical protein Tco_1444148 [Tanacetum coccineum]
MCYKKNSILFTDTECVVVSPDFKLTDENHVLLKVPRKNNMYSIDLRNVVPQGALTYLFAKATPDESNLWHRRLRQTQDTSFSSSLKDPPDAGFKPLGEEGKKDAKDMRNKSGNPPEGKDSEVPSTEELRINQEKVASVNSTNNINTVSPTVNAASIEDNVVDENIVYGCVDDLNIPDLEEIDRFSNDEDDGVEADMTNLDTHIPVSPIPTTRIHKDHPVEQIIRDIHSAPQTKRMTKSVTEHAMFSSAEEDQP